jgi:hypothetical protein
VVALPDIAELRLMRDVPLEIEGTVAMGRLTEVSGPIDLGGFRMSVKATEDDTGGAFSLLEAEEPRWGISTN